MAGNEHLPILVCPNCLRLQNRILEHETRIRKLEATIEELRRGGKRQAAPFSKGPPKPDPKTPGRKPGENYGTKAHREPPTSFDEVHQAPLPPQCPHCRSADIDEMETAEQYQEEIPRKPIRRKFIVHIGRCRCCGRRVQGRHPFQTSDALGAAASQLGPNAQAMVVQLNKELGASQGKTTRFIGSFFGISVTPGGSTQVMLRVARRAQPVYQSILIYIRNSHVVNPDETGWKVGGLLWWMWVFVAKKATAYVLRHSRGSDVPEEILGLDYAGLMGHDGYKPYDAFEKATHQSCLSHYLARCRELLETSTGRALDFPRHVKDFLQKSLALRDRRDAGEITPHGLLVSLGRIRAGLDRILVRPRQNEENDRFSLHLLRHSSELFTFLVHPEIEATNWPAEQAIRPITVNRKVWGGNRTENGGKAQEILSSVLRTCWQQKRDSIEFLSRLLRTPKGQPLPRLIC